MLKKLRPDYPTPHIAVIFDPKGEQVAMIFSLIIKRIGEAPEELVAQIKPLHAVIEAMGLPVFIQPGIEADDDGNFGNSSGWGRGYQVVIQLVIKIWPNWCHRILL